MEKVACTSESPLDTQIDVDASPASKLANLLHTPEVETYVRRTLRIRDKNDCFKHNSCAEKNCLACAAILPSIPTSILKTIGEKVCKISSEKLFDEALSAKGSSKKVIGEKRNPRKEVATRKEAEKSKKKKVVDDDN